LLVTAAIIFTLASDSTTIIVAALALASTARYGEKGFKA
jgi:hypothetical protein